MGNPVENSVHGTNDPDHRRSIKVEGLRSQTLAAQALGEIDPSTGGVVPAVYPSVPFQRNLDGSFPNGRVYTRDQNPGYELPERLLAQLEGGQQAMLFSSGMAAATAVFDALPAGSRVVAPRQMYFNLRNWLQRQHQRGDLELDFFEAGDLDSLTDVTAAKPTALLWLETPANPTCEITDLKHAAEIGKRSGALIVADSTVASPVITRPIEYGVDIVMHSATKVLNGHSDVLAGALIAARSDSFWAEIRGVRVSRGSVLGPFESWLLLRGMRTLFLRVSQSSQTALAVARHLEQHPLVQEVFYPGLESHPGHKIAARQMESGFGFLLSFRVVGDGARARTIANSLRVFKQATSLGGVESLVEHRASVEGETTLLPDDLLRLSIGIEDPRDLIRDLDQAL